MRTPTFPGIAMPKATLYVCLLVVLTVIGVNCKLEETAIPIFPKTNNKFIIGQFENEVEQLFFNLSNQGRTLGSNIVRPRTNYVPEILIDIYNQVLLDNEQDSFVYNVALRLGYPLWFEYRIENSGDTLPEIIYIPLAHKDTNEISAYLIGWKDYHATSPELYIDIRMRSEMDSIKAGLKPYTYSTCHEALRFMMFDSIIFQRPYSDYDSILTVACLPDQMVSLAPSPITPRSCTSQIEKMCEWVDDGHGWQNGTTGGYVDWVYDDNWWDDDIYIIPNGPPLDLGGSAGGGGGGITVNNATWWKTNPVKKYIPMTFTGEPNIKNRGFVLICSDFLVIRCQYGAWWQIVAQVPCEACDEQEAYEKAMEAWCRSEGVEFISTYGITGITEPKLAMMATMGCCDEFSVDEDCIIRDLFNALVVGGGLTDVIPYLNECEIDWLKENPLRLSGVAQATALAYLAEREVMNSSTFNLHGCGDAFRHAYWNALMTAFFSDNESKAEEMADAHECEPVLGFESAREMDFHNNEKGREIGQLYNDAIITNMRAAVCSLLVNGHLVVLDNEADPASNLIDSDTNNCECQ